MRKNNLSLNLKTTFLCYAKFYFWIIRGGANICSKMPHGLAFKLLYGFLFVLFFIVEIKEASGQGACPLISLTDCENFDITVCQRTVDIPTPPNCTGCTAVPIDCHRIQYVVRLSANDGVTDSTDPDALCFELSYTDLELQTLLSFTGTSSGMTRINKTATESTCAMGFSLAVDEETNSVGFSYGTGGTLPTIEFTRNQTNAPFFAELFTIVVDVYPTDVFELSCSFFRYADGDNGTCYFPNASVPPAPNFIAPLPFQLLLDEDENVLFLTDTPTPTPSASTSDVTIPLRIRSNHMSPSAQLTIPYLDFVFTVESSAPIPPPIPQNASNYEVEISPATGLNSFYTIKARLTGSALLFSNSFGVLDMFSLKIDRPNPQNMVSTIDLTYLSGRFEGQFLTTPPGATFCKKMVKGSTGDRTVEFPGDAVCANSGLSLNIAGTAGDTPGNCGELFATVSLGIPYNSPVRELRFVLDFDMTAGAYIDVANIQNNLPCNVGNNLQSCLDKVGTQECYEVDGNTLTYCFKTSSNNVINYTGGTMVIPVSAISGCINKVTVREAAYYIVGQGTVTCVPSTSVTGFYLCSQEISGAVKFGECWIEEVNVQITEEDNACDDQTVITGCPLDPTFSPTPYSYCVCDEGTYLITPEKDDNPANGVTTYDLVLISKHILGIEPLNSPYKMIAADVNNSTSVTTFDIVEARKLILGIYTTFPDNTSWRFLPRELELNVTNPFISFINQSSESITATIDNNGIDYSFLKPNPTPGQPPVSETSTTADFVGIKVGDVNCTAIACGNNTGICNECGTHPQRPANPTEHFDIEMPGLNAKAGEVVILPIYAGSSQPLIAYQAGLHFDPARFEFVAISAGNVLGFTPDCLNLKEVGEGKIKVLWLSFDYESNYLQTGQALFYVALRALSDVGEREQIVTMEDAIFQNLGYTADNYELPLQVALQPSNSQREQISGGTISANCVPNPTSSGITLSLESKTSQAARIAIFGPYGVRMYYRELELGKGVNSLPIVEVTDWSTGIYTWQVQAGTEKVTGRFVKQ